MAGGWPAGCEQALGAESAPALGALQSPLLGRVVRGSFMDSSAHIALEKHVDDLHMGSLYFEFGINLRIKLSLDSQAARGIFRKTGVGP